LMSRAMIAARKRSAVIFASELARHREQARTT
jgi:hypothetical protein